jgi:integrase
VLLQEFCEHYVSTNPNLKSQDSIRLLRTSCVHYTSFLGRQAWLSDLTDEKFTAYIQHRLALHKSRHTVEREAAKLMTLWRAAARRGMIREPIIRVRKEPPTVPVALLKTEIRRLFRAMYGIRSEVGEVPGALYFQALYGVLWDSSERIGSLMEVEPSDVRFIGTWIIWGAWIHFRIRKGGGAPTQKRVRAWTARKLWRLVNRYPKHKKVFGFVNRTTIYKPARRIYKDAGVQVKRGIFHVFRRSVASHLDAKGENAQKALGHADAKTTRDHYIDPTISQPRQFVDKLFSPLSLVDRARGWLHF